MTNPIPRTDRPDPYKGFRFRLRPRVRRPNRSDLRLSRYAQEGIDAIVEAIRRQELAGALSKSESTALFLGPSGTGKTLAAEVVADELGLDLFRVDLSSLVSKYVGETERHLDRIFTAASSANAVLFFDEADSIFGKRSEVKDAHDRFSNTEVSYLLSRIEEYRGLVILATSRKSSLDAAFLRRIRYAVEFPLPL